MPRLGRIALEIGLAVAGIAAAAARPAGAGLDLAAAAAAPPAASLRPGEPARPGEEGVSRWIEGSRQGGGLREVAAAPPPGAEGIAEPPADRGTLAAMAPERASDAL